MVEKFKVDISKCIYCAGCVSVCPTAALTLNETRVYCDEGKCVACGVCEKACPVNAIRINKGGK
ncbi:TPA: 4Fe-4S binding protein [Candidatus Micrarchaeota archaeon]|nr:MAG: hypothetical protein AUJ65_00820 [Candidatus Micrarchaeota archaeon CG1_02_51_15]HII38553.1 4Fe-4S binding protein [Candidatus Micrarchaeota archaeon]